MQVLKVFSEFSASPGSASHFHVIFIHFTTMPLQTLRLPTLIVPPGHQGLSTVQTVPFGRVALRETDPQQSRPRSCLSWIPYQNALQTKTQLSATRQRVLYCSEQCSYGSSRDK